MGCCIYSKGAMSPGVLESEFSGQDSSPSPVGFESESRCLWLESVSQVVEMFQLYYKVSSTIPYIIL